MNTIKRQLNIELLRIFAMVLILLWHILIHFTPPHSLIATILYKVCVFISFHVDVFVLITGYFGILTPKRTFSRTLLLCVFYAFGCNLVSEALGKGFSWHEVLMPLSHSPWWFLKVYLLLVLISPLLEVFVRHANSRQFYSILGIVAFVDIYFGFILHLAPYYNHGYDIFNFVLLYFLGCTLRRNNCLTLKLKTRIYIPAILFFICCVIRWKVQPYKSDIWFDYNSPLALTMAISVFCLFLQLKVPSCFTKFIKFISSSAISVYLITDHHTIRETLLRPLFQQGIKAIGENTTLQLLFIFAFIVTSFTLCCCIDKVRMLLFDVTTKGISKLSKHLV